MLSSLLLRLLEADTKNSRKTFNVSIGDAALNKVDSVWYLGVIINPTLSSVLGVTHYISNALRNIITFLVTK